MRQLLFLASLFLTTGLIFFGCTPKPPPEPNYPTVTDAGPPVDAAPSDCSKFAGKWKVKDTVIMVDGTCAPGPITSDLLTLDAVPFPEDQANEGWRAVLFTSDSTMMSGPASQIEERPWTCRFVVEASEAPPGAIFSRDFLLGEVPDRGRGEAAGRDGECVWKTSSLLERF
jgi:hypothetical protein